MKIAAYGTLRGGQHSAKYLTDKYGKDSVREIDTRVVYGYALYHAPRYGFDCPFAVKSDDEKSQITVTLLEISDSTGAAQDIDRGENWGYVKTAIDGDIFMYVARDEQIQKGDLQKVQSGDWLNRDKKKSA